MNSNGNDRPVSDGGLANTPSKTPFRALDLPLAGLRIVTTRPPLNWFGGVDFDFATEMAEELRALGRRCFRAGHSRLHISEPGLCKSSHPGAPVVSPGCGNVAAERHCTPSLCSSGQGQNIFRDILQIPVIMLWDHGLLQWPRWCLYPLPETAVPVHPGIDPEAPRGFESSPVPSLLAR